MEFDFNKYIMLENDRVLLSPVSLDHFDDLILESSKDKNLVQFSPYEIYTEKLLKENIKQAIKERENNTRYAFSIYDKQAKKYVGCTSFGNISNQNQSIEIGWTWIGKDYQRTGLNRSCKYAMLHFAFEKLGFHRVEFRTDERNVQSREAIEKIGGKLDGCLRENTLMLDGFRRTTAYYSILQNEWEEVKQKVFEQAVA